MKIYTHTKDGVASGKVVEVDRGYVVGPLCLHGETSGWDMYRRTYASLLGLLRAVARNGHFVSLAD